MAKNEKVANLTDLTRAKVFEAIPPTYILDEAYHFVEWNKAFEEIVAKPRALKIGMHAVEFVYLVENSKQALERSAKVFSIGNIPATDHEPLLFKSKPYGIIEFQKLAVALRHPTSDEVTWVVSLNICKAEKLDKLFTDLLAIASRAVNEK